ncbi:unnamed protein product [Rotaria socialis]|uniref:Ciliary microtubule inner protein 2A-C-like domain-containing protein n=1 Tax=Rotaria socialis TaxID=392032 RepID=A0A821DFS8_9BILA|nr:unnamed protein product [Rotaria socialis]
MTTVEFGGGPTLEACQQFANLKDGSEIPKYTGHIHQLRFRQGHTYGEETHILSKEFPHLIKRSKSDAIVKYDQPDPYVTRDFPDGLIPGYTGVGLGSRYHEATKKSLHRFAVETTNSTTNFPTTVDNQSLSPNYAARPDYTRSLIDFTQTRPKSSSSFKIYNPTGMVPKYTGYLPQRKYRVGQTFGDTTRGLPVCSDLSSSSLGDFA